MFRVLSILFFLLSLITLGADLYIYRTTDGTVRLTALGEFWARIDRHSLLHLQSAAEQYVGPDFWNSWVRPVLEWPAAIEFAVMGVFFWLLRRRKPQNQPSERAGVPTNQNSPWLPRNRKLHSQLSERAKLRANEIHINGMCRWRRDQWRSPQAAMTRWICLECGVDGFASDDQPPEVCKRHLRDARL